MFIAGSLHCVPCLLNVWGTQNTPNMIYRAQKQVPKSLDVFGWCTWDAFYFRVSAKGIMDGLRSLKDGGVSPKLLVIDDGESSSQAFVSCSQLLGITWAILLQCDLAMRTM